MKYKKRIRDCNVKDCASNNSASVHFKFVTVNPIFQSIPNSNPGRNGLNAQFPATKERKSANAFAVQLSTMAHLVPICDKI